MLKKLNIAHSEYCILGSASLVIRNLKVNANDLDISITPKGFKDLKKRFIIKSNKLIINNNEIEFIIKNRVEMNVEIFNNYPLQELLEMLNNKKRKGLKKDEEIIVKLEKYIKGIKDMGEYVDLYDENKKLTGEKIFREKGKKAITPKGRYTIVVLAFIKDSKGNYLIQKTSARKKGVWALPGGHVKSGQSSLEAIREELFEEMGIDIAIEDIELFKTYKYENAFKDVYIIHSDIDLNTIKIEEDEVEKVAYFSKNEIYNLITKSKIRQTNIDAIQDIFNEN